MCEESERDLFFVNVLVIFFITIIIDVTLTLLVIYIFGQQHTA